MTVDPILSPGQSAAVYTITVTRLSEFQSLGVNLVDDNTIQDLAGNRLRRASFSIFEDEDSLSGIDAYAMLVIDIDGNGTSDLVYADRTNSTASVLPGNGDGTFADGTSYATGSGPKSLATGDFDNDGDLDIVVAFAAGFDAGFSVLLQDALGGFVVQPLLSASTFPTSVAVADIDGDGNLDLVATLINGPDNVVALLGNGDGTFAVEFASSAGTGARFLVIADVNLDNLPDLVVVDDHISILLGNGTQAFPARTQVLDFEFPAAVAVSDVNGDAIPDLVVASGSSSVGVLLGVGNGEFTFLEAYGLPEDPESLALSDFNGDGLTDFVVSTRNFGAIVYFGQGAGAFERVRNFDIGQNFDFVTAGDINGDGRPEFITNEPPGLRILLNTLRGDFTGETYTFPAVSISFAQQEASVLEGEVADSELIFTVQLSRPSLNTVTVAYATQDATALRIDGDYVEQSNVLIFAPGETTKLVTVLVRGDSRFEPDETLTLELSNPVNASLDEVSAEGTILNDDAAPSVTISDATINEGGVLTFQVLLSAASSVPVVIPFETTVALSGNLATPEIDYISTSGTITFLPNVVQQTISVQTLTDLLSEPDEIMRVELGALSVGTLRAMRRSARSSMELPRN